MQLHEQLTAFLSPESMPVHKRVPSSVGSIPNNNRSRLPFIIPLAVGVPILLAIVFGTYYYRARERRAFVARYRQPPARVNRSWGERRVRNNGTSAAAPMTTMVEPPPPVYTGTVAPGANVPNLNKPLPGFGPGLNPTSSPQVGGGSSEAPPSYTYATASEEGRARS